MSRTKKGAKNPTHEYWGKRAGNAHGAAPGPAQKKITNGLERARAKEKLRKEVEAIEADCDLEMGIDRSWKED